MRDDTFWDAQACLEHFHITTFQGDGIFAVFIDELSMIDKTLTDAYLTQHQDNLLKAVRILENTALNMHAMQLYRTAESFKAACQSEDWFDISAAFIGLTSVLKETQNTIGAFAETAQSA
jgi:hypothetical protein